MDFKVSHFIRFIFAVTLDDVVIMSRYRNLQPKYLNTDVNASTVKHLLQTVNSISKQCKVQYANEDDLERVRSIIYLHRPHLRFRYDLHVPELVMEALMPNSTVSNNIPNQITHNFNYKYDYNTNYPVPTIVPAPVTNVDPFGMPVVSPSPQQPQNATGSTAVPVQNYYINTAPNNGGNVPLQNNNNNNTDLQQAPPQLYAQQQQQQQQHSLRNYKFLSNNNSNIQRQFSYLIQEDLLRRRLPRLQLLFSLLVLIKTMWRL
ncbi:desmoplakin [Apocheima cinerarium nucleopolyhedrovirus]|uniref:desmoplakin n=1 Tax=Apocheima cinerarium nucleopolyhedrovirus TaxID=307461 RepID=UPI0001D92084|nr:desmoplakin [Apocheima cinerarium nucleopolyhedrovirus]ADB84406.1 desmoplakin [Apocheima cinerarium nucleopolyhedrovirus]